jgi:hypothetical protein
MDQVVYLVRNGNQLPLAPRHTQILATSVDVSEHDVHRFWRVIMYKKCLLHS